MKGLLSALFVVGLAALVGCDANPSGATATPSTSQQNAAKAATDTEGAPTPSKTSSRGQTRLKGGQAGPKTAQPD
jgi:hypothetical protein